MVDPVLAVDRYRTNAGLMRAAYRLGHLRDDWSVLDATYGKGTWWRGREAPKGLLMTTNDLDEDSTAIHHYDFRDFPGDWYDQFDVVAYDPPYGLRGTVNKTNGGYGLGSYLSIDDRHRLMVDGMRECCRVARYRVLAKCQDQVASGRLWWQTRLLTDTAEYQGWDLVERLDMAGGRKQPERFRWRCLACGKDNCGPRHCCRAAKVRTDKATGERLPWLERHKSPQDHAYNRPSSLLIFAPGKN